jgi:hypothetical protein
MANFVLAYRGGSVPETEAEQQAVMEAWMGWFGGLGGAVVDGGAPFGASMSRTGDSAPADGADSQLTGYSILTAGSLAEATELAAGCPILSRGGTVDVYESMPM